MKVYGTISNAVVAVKYLAEENPNALQLRSQYVWDANLKGNLSGIHL